MRKKVLIASYDRGGALALRPVVQALRKNKAFKASICASRKLARPILAQNKVRSYPLSQYITEKQAHAILDRQRPNLLLTGSSWDSDAEQRLRNAAFSKGIPSLVVLDYWNSFRSRWKGATYRVKRLPDVVCVMDSTAKNDMEKLGFPSGALKVTGQPYLERLFSSSINKSTRPVGTCKVLFLSQPCKVDPASTSTSSLIGRVVRAVKKFERNLKKKCFVTVKLHPKEVVTRGLKASMGTFHRQNERVKIIEGSRTTTNITDKLIADSDVIFGVSTMALFQARAAGKKVYHLDVLLLSRSLRSAMREVGIEIIMPTQIGIYRALCKQNVNQRVNKSFHVGATEAVLRVLYKAAIINV